MAKVARSLWISPRLGAEGRKVSSAARSGFALLAAAWLAACSAGGGGGSGSVASTIEYTGPARWLATGPQGGPFTGASFDVLLRNMGQADARWSASAVPSFVQLDAHAGVIPPASQVIVHAQLDAAVADALAAGPYSEQLAFHNDDGTQADVGVDCELSIAAPGIAAGLAPATGFAADGPASGPFVPDSMQYSLTNTGTATLSWRADVQVPWIVISPQSSQLAPGDSVPILLSIDDPATGGLGLGLHLVPLDILDSTNDVILVTREVSLNVSASSSGSGWTVFTPSADTRTIYVSSSTGDDSNDGLSHASAKRTIAAGKALLRDGFPDWLLLKRGDSWTENLDTDGEFRLNGRSLAERMLVSTYGSGDRPLLRTGLDNGVDNITMGNHVAIVGLHFWADLYDGSQEPNRGVQWLGPCTDFLLEDCYLQAYQTNVVVMGSPDRQTNATIRRNVIVDAYNTQDTNSEGIYAEATDGLLIEENVLDHNGWRDDVPGSDPTWFRRNVYLQNGCTGIVFRGNIVAGTDGLQLRPGGICEDNLFLRNALALQFGSGNTPEPNGVSGLIRNNVILDSRDLQAGSPRGSGLILGNTVNTVVEYNVVAHNVSGSQPIPWVLNFDNGHGNPAGMQNVFFRHNVVYDWGGTGANAEIATDFENILLNLVLEGNDIQDSVDSTYLVSLASTTTDLLAQIHGANNRWYRASGNASQMFQIGGVDMSFDGFTSAIGDTSSTWEAVAYPDPNRTIATYHASIGGAPSLQAFLSEARNQSRSFWRVQYTANAVNTYVRAGFGL